MLKYVDVREVFSEIPDEITLAINISNCPCRCPGCHSSYLSQDIGKELTWGGWATKNTESLFDLIKKHRGITCVALMGGDSDPRSINNLAERIKWTNSNVQPYVKEWHGEEKWQWNPVKVAWYSGRQELSKDIDLRNFDYIKLGPYIEELGPLSSQKTNQRLYEVQHASKNELSLVDITYKFWKDEDVRSSTDNA